MPEAPQENKHLAGRPGRHGGPAPHTIFCILYLEMLYHTLYNLDTGTNCITRGLILAQLARENFCGDFPDFGIALNTQCMKNDGVLMGG